MRGMDTTTNHLPITSTLKVTNAAIERERHWQHD